MWTEAILCICAMCNLKSAYGRAKREREVAIVTVTNPVTRQPIEALFESRLALVHWPAHQALCIVSCRRVCRLHACSRPQCLALAGST